MNMSYGMLAMELGYGAAPKFDQRSVISWLQDGELIHLPEQQWNAFTARFNLHIDLQPGTLVDQETAAAIRAAAGQDPGVEPALEHLDDLTAAAVTRMHDETRKALTAVLGVASGGTALASPATIDGLLDAIVGRLSPIARELAHEAYRMDR